MHCQKILFTMLNFSLKANNSLLINQSNSYRPDIDGLRAIACLAVVLFHAFPHSLKGAFQGGFIPEFSSS